LTNENTGCVPFPKRESGVLLHITSLPSPYGVGDLGPEAYAFVDFLVKTRQHIWQVLPLTLTDPLYGNSPYSSISAFAGNKILISPDLLIEEGLLTKKDLEPVPLFPAGRCDFSLVIPYKTKLLELAYRNFKGNGAHRESFEAFCSKNRSWLDDFSFFIIIKKHMAGKSWARWPEELRDRAPQSLESVKKEYSEQLEREKFWQYLFFEQWHRLKSFCREKGVQLFGDLAIYVNFDSADVWANPGLFKLDEEKKPVFVSGVPPDYFSSTGQLWGNPVYQWDVLRESAYQWWVERVAHHLDLFDILRIDHFRGLVACWEIPVGEDTAVNGKWVNAPARDFLICLRQRFNSLPIVGEDLGVITPDVREVMRCFGLPGMKVLLFAFGEDDPQHPYLPHNYERNFVLYTGTHDNNTVRGWFECEASSNDIERFFRYAGREVPVEEVHWEFIRLAMISVANQVIIPMQDILGLGGDTRMNRPSVAAGNWEWRLRPDQITQSTAQKLLEMTKTYGRG
jgi:4-alpha-glucanotransferase